MELLIGADPELFVCDGKQGHAPRSAYGLIEGTKENPCKVKDGSIQVDGMALEFNTKPTADVDEFEKNVQSLLGELQDRIPSDYKFIEASAIYFHSDHYNKQPTVAKMLGCDPDYNAWTGELNSPPKGAKGTQRTAAGHIHLGWTDKEIVTNPDYVNLCRMVVRQLDCTLGLASVLEDEKGVARRNMYGRAGAFRPKEYGVEYRVLSNYWIFSKEATHHVFNMAKKAFNKLVEKVNCIDILQEAGVLPDHVQMAINAGIRSDAQNYLDILKDYDDELDFCR